MNKVYLYSVQVYAKVETHIRVKRLCARMRVCVRVICARTL